MCKCISSINICDQKTLSLSSHLYSYVNDLPLFEVDFRRSYHRYRISVVPGSSAPACDVRENDETEETDDASTTSSPEHPDDHTDRDSEQTDTTDD